MKVQLRSVSSGNCGITTAHLGSTTSKLGGWPTTLENALRKIHEDHQCGYTSMCVIFVEKSAGASVKDIKDLIEDEWHGDYSLRVRHTPNEYIFTLYVYEQKDW